MVTQKEEAIFKGWGAGSHTLGKMEAACYQMLSMQTCYISICHGNFPASTFSSCRSEVEHATPQLWRLSALVASDKVTINSPTCKKIIWYKGFQNVLLSPYKPANKWYRNEVRKESPPPPNLPGPWIHLPTSEPIQGKGWDWEQQPLGGQVEFGGRALHYKIWQAFASLQLLCVSHIIEKHELSSARSAVTPLDPARSLQMLIVL